MYTTIDKGNLYQDINHIKFDIENGNFGFYAEDEKYCDYCVIKFMCNIKIVNDKRYKI